MTAYPVDPAEGDRVDAQRSLAPALRPEWDRSARLCWFARTSAGSRAGRRPKGGARKPAGVKQEGCGEVGLTATSPPRRSENCGYQINPEPVPACARRQPLVEEHARRRAGPAVALPEVQGEREGPRREAMTTRAWAAKPDALGSAGRRVESRVLGGGAAPLSVHAVRGGRRRRSAGDWRTYATRSGPSPWRSSGGAFSTSHRRRCGRGAAHGPSWGSQIKRAGGASRAG